MKKIYLLLSFCISFGMQHILVAQQDAQFSQYMFNGMYYSPGFAGLDGMTRATFIHRTQWLSYNPSLPQSRDANSSYPVNYSESGGAPQTNILTIQSLTPFLNKSLGAGLTILQDVFGPLRTFQVQLTGSYIIKMKGGNLGLGIRAGFFNQAVRNLNEYRVINTEDEVYKQLTTSGGNLASQTKPDVNIGVAYRTNKYYAGFSFAHLIRSSFSYGFDQSINKVANHMYLTGGYNFNLGSMIVLTPSLLVQSDFQQLSSVYGAIATYNDKFWFGINLRQSFAKKDLATGGSVLRNDDVVFLVGANLLKNKQNNNALKIGYAFDFVTSGANAKTRTSHEILLSYLIVPPWDILKPKIRTPRYRHDEN
ncbi:MAG: type IX secretion system membrane protein PorP/SprF [Cytophagales bacterium]|nr:MAG: type IX secretion system membrane protein PorP/SprF [Cytophagales bacterium]